MLGRGIAHLTIYLPALALYLIVLPHIYGFSTLGDPLQLLALGSVFLLATSFMAQAVGAWFKRPETPTLIFLATSLTQFFLTGFAWPREGIPQAALVTGYVFPADFAINGIVRINQLGASLAEVVQDWRDSGSWPSFISRWLWCPPMSSSGGGDGLHDQEASTSPSLRFVIARRRWLLSPVATPTWRRRSWASYARPRFASRPKSAASSLPSRSKPARACAQERSSPSCLRSS